MGNQVFSIRSWMESNAVEQFQQVLDKQDIISGAGMPDMHLGKYGPNGSVFLSEKVHPVLAGNDIGCGYSFAMFNGTIDSKRLNKRIRGLDDIELDSDIFLSEKHNDSIGTIGGGNHFLEFQRVHSVVDQSLFDNYGINEDSLYSLVHSGSRGWGTEILESVISVHNDHALTGDDANSYMLEHDKALDYAFLNRRGIIEKAMIALNMDSKLLFDVPHNFIEKTGQGFIHRKGASTATRGLVMVPGSRGDYSYLVEPIAKEEALYSIAHGAGRKIARNNAKYRADKNKNSIDSIVICDDKSLMIEEDASCYKNISHVVDDLIAHGLIKVIAVMRPVLTYKYEDKSIDHKQTQKQKDIERKTARKEKYRKERR